MQAPWLYPLDKDRELIAVLMRRSEEVIRKINPDKWLAKQIVGTWQVVKEEETTTAKFRKDGVLEIRRKHENILIGALNSVLNGTIFYSWSIKDGKLYTARIGSETQMLDRAQLIIKGDSVLISMDEPDRVQAGFGNPVGYKTPWVRIGY